jgi:hypothetical protein
MEVPKKIEGKPICFEIVRIGKTLIKLKDGNYIQITAVPTKVLKQAGAVDPEGNPVYIVNTSNVLSVWRPEQIKEMEE